MVRHGQFAPAGGRCEEKASRTTPSLRSQPLTKLAQDQHPSSRRKVGPNRRADSAPYSSETQPVQSPVQDTGRTGHAARGGTNRKSRPHTVLFRVRSPVRLGTFFLGNRPRLGRHPATPAWVETGIDPGGTTAGRVGDDAQAESHSGTALWTVERPVVPHDRAPPVASRALHRGV